jgi:hypothetical protein
VDRVRIRLSKNDADGSAAQRVGSVTAKGIGGAGRKAVGWVILRFAPSYRGAISQC